MRRARSSWPIAAQISCAAGPRAGHRRRPPPICRAERGVAGLSPNRTLAVVSAVLRPARAIPGGDRPPQPGSRGRDRSRRQTAFILMFFQTDAPTIRARKAWRWVGSGSARCRTRRRSGPAESSPGRTAAAPRFLARRDGGPGRLRQGRAGSRIRGSVGLVRGEAPAGAACWASTRSRKTCWSSASTRAGKPGDQDWVMDAQPPLHNLWTRLVPLAARQGFTLLPYYEYKGALGLPNCPAAQPRLAAPRREALPRHPQDRR